MSTLVRQRCLNHGNREAVGRCPECQKYFCRECISEHDDRILCTACLSKLLAPATPSTNRFDGIVLLGLGILAAIAIWFFFFLIGQAMLAIPARFHEGTLWKTEESE